MKKVILCMLGLLLIVFYTCEKDKEDEPFVNNHPEALSESEAKILEDMDEAVGFDYSTVILPNGEILYDFLMKYNPDFLNERTGKTRNNDDPYKNLGPQDARNLLIGSMNKIALDLTDRSKHQYKDVGIDMPYQNGLAYSWNGKNHSIRQKPSSPSVCKHKIYGLDCSGFIYQLFQSAGVDMVVGNANKQRMPEIVQKIIRSSIPSLDRVKVEDLGEIPTTEFESGDIIYWIKNSGAVNHIGMILKKENGGLAVFQSSGTEGLNDSECKKNLSLTRGPRRIELNHPYWFGSEKSYGITRINAELSGSWKLFLRCSEQSADAIEFDLEFPTTSENNFEVTGVGTDYDGELFNCSIDMSYNNVTNTLSGTSYITKQSNPYFYRYDSFSVKLDRDDTNYFSLTLGDSNEAGCDLEGRFLNKKNSTTAKSTDIRGNVSVGGSTLNKQRTNAHKHLFIKKQPH